MIDKDLPSDSLIEALFERLQDECIRCTDPYDVYVNRIKASVFGNISKVSTRIEDGYRAIVEDIARAN